MFSALKRTFAKRTSIAEKDIKKILSALEVRLVKRKKNILDAGDEPDYMFFLNKGLFRGYIYDEQGDEQTTDLISEGNWFGDLKAFTTQKRSTLYLEALEDSQVFLLSRKDIYRFYDEIPMFERSVKQTMENYYVKAIDRARKINYAGLHAQDRYKQFVMKCPTLEKRVPALYLASYLGIKPETLSRLRHPPDKTHEHHLTSEKKLNEF